MSKIPFKHLTIFVLGGALVIIFWLLPDSSLNYQAIAVLKAAGEIGGKTEIAKPAIKHLPTPTPTRGIYMTSWVAGNKNFRDQLIKLADESEVNAIVIDVKDYTGRIAFAVSDLKLQALGSANGRIPDIRALIDTLHEKNIYAIARIAAFQDPYFSAKRPDLTVKRRSTGEVWRDFKGARWLDPAAPEVWDYLVAIGREAYAAGFDELNFDYIRFPSDGDMRDISYPFFDKTGKTKAALMADFFSYLRDQLKETGAPLSADFFGMTTTNTDDLNIGQLLEVGALYFDYVAPMVYPSHYPPTFMGFPNPAARPYEVINHSLNEAIKRLAAASSTATKLRPWLQDFDLGAIYTSEMVRKEKQAVYDAGLTSWMLWAPSNYYTTGALDK